MEVRDRRILKKIIQYCQRIEENLARYQHEFEAFQSDHMLQDACCMCIVQIGELVAQLSDTAKQEAPTVPWRVTKKHPQFLRSRIWLHRHPIGMGNT